MIAMLFEVFSLQMENPVCQFPRIQSVPAVPIGRVGVTVKQSRYKAHALPQAQLIPLLLK